LDALLTTFLLAALGEWGDKTQILVLLLAVRFGKPVPVLAGVAVGALANAALAAAGGTIVHGFITLRATSLLVAVALLYAGIANFARPKRPDMAEGWRTGPFLTTAICFFLLEFGDKTQFLTFAISAQYGTPVLAAWAPPPASSRLQRRPCSSGRSWKRCCPPAGSASPSASCWPWLASWSQSTRCG
jgi:putative Ca2+/H+ antiporter (TMEM165/GDT1 family)